MQDQTDAGTDVQPSTEDNRGLLGFSLAYPGENGWETPLIGAILFLFSWLIIPLFIVAGYFVRLTRAAGRGEPDPPEFDDWGGMLVDGLLLIVVFIPIVVVYAIVVVVAAEIHEALGILVSFLALYPLPGAYMNYAVRDNWKAAYDVSTLGSQITTRTYLIGFLVYAFVINGIGAIVAIVLLVLSLLTIVGWIILWPLIYFYWYGIDASLWGRVYARLESA